MTERKHFDDLTKIDVQIGLLDDDTYNRLRSHTGALQSWFDKTLGWVDCLPLKWGTSAVYRAKPQPLTKPAVPWEHMADWVQYVARDEDGTLWASDIQLFPKATYWATGIGNQFECLDAFKIDPGTCDWRDSLVKRPEGL